jgi:hypothetical protein
MMAAAAAATTWSTMPDPVLAATGQRGPQTVVEPVAESAEDAHVSSYAREWSVSPAEAARRLRAQAEFGSVVDELRRVAPQRFAGSWINHDGDFGLVVRFTGDRPPSGAAEIASATAEDVQLRPSARRSLQETEAILDAGGVELDRVASVTGAFYDVKDEVFVLDMVAPPAPTQSAAAVTTALRATLPDTLPAEIRAARINLTAVPNSPGRRGGLDMTTCTSGFSVRDLGDPNLRGIVTAAHCSNSQQYRMFGSTTWQTTTFRRERLNAYVDVQFHSIAGQTVEPRFHADLETNYRNVTGTLHRSSQNGHSVCHRGKTTNYSCGTVTSITYRHSDCGSETCAATWIRVEGSQLRCYFGDSGGPWFHNTTAYGIYWGQSSSGTSASDCDRAIYMAVNPYLTNWLGVNVIFS